jgi:phosphoserine phosphatase
MIDMDSTLVRSEGIDELAKEAGVGEAVAAITRRAMNGELDFPAALRERVGLLRGLPVEALDRVAERTELSAGAEILIDVLQKGGCAVVVVSGGFDCFTSRLQTRLRLDDAFANRLEVQDGRLTGRLVGEIVDGRRKAELLDRMAHKVGTSLDRVLAIGDGANDLPMLERAGLGIAYNAKPAVREVAPATLSVPNLAGVLVLLGYTESELPV